MIVGVVGCSSSVSESREWMNSASGGETPGGDVVEDRCFGLVDRLGEAASALAFDWPACQIARMGVDIIADSKCL